MTNPNLELRKQVAERMGWTELELDLPIGSLVGRSPDGVRGPVPPWELSLDACFRDLVPVAESIISGHYKFYLGPDLVGDDGWEAKFVSVFNPYPYVSAISTIPATALCKAFIALVEREK